MGGEPGLSSFRVFCGGRTRIDGIRNHCLSFFLSFLSLSRHCPVTSVRDKPLLTPFSRSKKTPFFVLERHLASRCRHSVLEPHRQYDLSRHHDLPDYSRHKASRQSLMPIPLNNQCYYIDDISRLSSCRASKPRFRDNSAVLLLLRLKRHLQTTVFPHPFGRGWGRGESRNSHRPALPLCLSFPCSP